MKIYPIPLESLIAKSVLKNGDTGKVSLQLENGALRMITLVEGLSKKHQNYAYILNRFKLPFRIDITLKTNSPAFKFKVGKGHILFTGSLNRGGFGIRRADILTGKEETTKNDYDNILPINEYVNLSIVYGSKKMWIEMNGQPCYDTNHAPYISLLEKNAIPEEHKDGLEFAIACGEKVELMIKSLVFTEYETNETHMSEKIANLPELSAFEWYLKSLPHELRTEAIKTDEYLMKEMKPSLKFKKSIDKDGKLSYESPCGFRYGMNRYGIGESHVMSWDQLGNVLNQIAETSPEFADRMFANIQNHMSGSGGEKCNQCATIACANMKTTEYNGKKRKSCGGAMQFQWIPSDFEDVRQLVSAVNLLVCSQK